MRKIASTFALFAVMLAILGLAVQAKEGKTMSWMGWISDSSCGAKGANADHKACATKCVKERGAAWVFVDSKTKDVVKIHNQDAVSGEADLGHEVAVTGHLMDDGALHIDKIAPAGR